jgi:hypothetical protein
MYVDAILKAPEGEPWVALTRVDSEGSTRSLGYLPPETLRLVAETLKTIVEVTSDDHWPAPVDPAKAEAWAEFVNWAEVVAELKAPEPAVKPPEPTRTLAPGPDGLRRVYIDEPGPEPGGDQ